MPYPGTVTIPPAVNTININSKAIINYEWAKRNPKLKRWIVIQIYYDEYTFFVTYYRFKYQYHIYNDDGTLVKSAFIDGEDRIYKPAPGIGGPSKEEIVAEAIQKTAYLAATQKIQDFMSKDYRGDNPDTPDSNDVPWDVPIDPQYLNKINYNPPPHRASRSPSLFYMANIERRLDKVSDTNSLGQFNSFGGGNQNVLPLGRIYQTESTAKALNKKYIQQQAGAKCLTDQYVLDMLKNGTGLWGFRFLYNPTSVRYDQSVDTSIDWFLNQQDPSRFFGGNMSVSFDLYINRIADLASMKEVNGRIVVNPDSYPGKELSDIDAAGLYYRGTEYDIEFLYRCVNGGPINTTLTTQGLPTADFGYVTGSPLWIHLHENLRFKGSLASLSVTHSSFSDRLVPMLSIVTLTFIRYPELEAIGGEKEVDEALATRNFGASGDNVPPGKTG